MNKKIERKAMLQTNNYKIIGSSHDVCQDYALSGLINTNIGYAIVTDGCSQSHNICGQVEIGSAILSHISKKYLMNNFIDYLEIYDPFKFNNREFNYNLVTFCKSELEDFEEKLSLNNHYSDSTLVFAMLDNKKNAYLNFFGDGCAFVKHNYESLNYKNIGYSIIDIEFESGAPLYLSYFKKNHYLDKYIEVFKDRKIFVNISKYDKDFNFIKDGSVSFSYNTDDLLKVNNLLSFEFVCGDVEMISVMSDGMKSFGLDYKDVVKEMNDFKNLNGVFVERRLKSVLKRYKKEDIDNFDDVSMATIINK